MTETISENEDEEEQYLCKLFGDECCFVTFFNETSRAIKLTSVLQMTGYSHMSWSTNAVIQPFQSFRWRFLGDSPNMSLYFLSLLPDPYSLARRNSYIWTVSYLDTTETEPIKLNNKVWKLSLNDLKELGPGEETTVSITRESKGVASLQKVSSDYLANNYSLTNHQLQSLQLPRTLQFSLATLFRDYEESKNNKMLPCPKCQEKHH